VRPDVGFHEGLLTRASKSDRKSNGPHRPRNIENSEARQREALEIADNLLSMPKMGKQDSLGQLRGGGGTFETELELEETPYPISSQDDESNANEQNANNGHDQTSYSDINDLEKMLSADVHEAVKEDPSTAEAAVAAAVERPATVIISQPLVTGGTKRVVVERTKVKFLDILSDGLESQDLEGINADEQKSWWISSHNTKLPEKWNIGKASPAARMMPSNLSEDLRNLDIMKPQEGDENCKIHVMDLNLDLGPKVGARKCNLAFKRVWPFSRRNWGIDGVTTLLAQDYQYSNEYWLAKAIRESGNFEPDASKADLIFVDNYCYHIAWLAYIHPLGNRNTTDPEPYMRKTLDKLVKSQRCEHVFSQVLIDI